MDDNISVSCADGIWHTLKDRTAGWVTMIHSATRGSPVEPKPYLKPGKNSVSTGNSLGSRYFLQARHTASARTCKACKVTEKAVIPHCNCLAIRTTSCTSFQGRTAHPVSESQDGPGSWLFGVPGLVDAEYLLYHLSGQLWRHGRLPGFGLAVHPPGPWSI